MRGPRYNSGILTVPPIDRKKDPSSWQRYSRRINSLTGLASYSLGAFPPLGRNARGPGPLRPQHCVYRRDGANRPRPRSALASASYLWNAEGEASLHPLAKP